MNERTFESAGNVIINTARMGDRDAFEPEDSVESIPRGHSIDIFNLAPGDSVDFPLKLPAAIRFSFLRA